MARTKKTQGKEDILEYRHTNSTRVNIPPAGLAARGEIVREKKLEYAYNPHLSPSLRFDDSGAADRFIKLLEESQKRQLTPEEVKILQEALRNHEPWLEWAGKREQRNCIVDPVALHIHERISTQAILRAAKREDVQRDLFADPEMDYREAVQFYRHPMGWTNRMILGDSLSVMASLSRREALAGKVQMIYMDPPYGIKYASNFQPEVGRRDVKDRDEDLTREPEMVKAYRDTWTLGVHSYLSYLRDRLLLSKELLADTGSIFVQIGEENLHLVRSLMDEVFTSKGFCRVIPYVTTSFQADNILGNVLNYLLWYCKDITKLHVNPIFRSKEIGELESKEYKWLLFSNGETRPLTDEEYEGTASIPVGSRVWRYGPITSQGYSERGSTPVELNGRVFDCGGNQHWKTNQEGISRLIRANQMNPRTGSLSYFMFLDYFNVTPLVNLWLDTKWGFDASNKSYVVQTNDKIIERCMLMTTDPGDLVLDPTCGSGTTAYVAEQWGRRWITIDVSRVALSIARQRILTSKFDYYKLRPTSAADVQRNPDGTWLTDPEGQIEGTSTFDCKTVPHVTLKSIAQNQALDPIFAKWEPVLADKLQQLNQALAETVSPELAKKLQYKLLTKQSSEGKRAITDADKRRWLLPPLNKTERNYTTVPNDFAGWYDWEVPFDTDPDWPEALKAALEDYRSAWRSKMDEVNACIAARADQEELVDQPCKDSKKIRVSGPFTFEGIIPCEENIDTEDSPIEGAPEEMDTFGGVEQESQNSEAYLDRMVRLIREDGVRFPNNNSMRFNTLETLSDGSILHAKGTWGEGENERQVGILFGPQYGPLIAPMVEDGIRVAARRGFDDLVFAAFSFDGAAQVAIQEDPDPRIRIHLAHISPDVNMGDLLKNTTSSQLFTVSGSPRTSFRKTDDDQFIVKMEGVDIYDPVTNVIRSTGAGKVAAWFLDTDYDGRCFCITQAFFPDKSAWEKIGKALNKTIDPAALEKLSGTESLPFSAGQHNRVAVKVIDPRGNEVMRVHKLVGEQYE